MNDQVAEKVNKMEALALPDSKKQKRTRAPKAPRAPRQRDPGILEIEQMAANLKWQYRLSQQSSGTLKRIEKLVGRLTEDDKAKLFCQLEQVATPALPLTVESPAGHPT